jgi:hypothetical protein
MGQHHGRTEAGRASHARTRGCGASGEEAQVWLWVLLGTAAAAVIALVVVLLATSGDGDDGDTVGDPEDVRSTSHEVGFPSTDPVIQIVWSRPAEPVQAYSIAWSEQQFELPDETGDLTGQATEATSPTLEPGSWFFHLRTQRADGTWTSTVHLGPFPIEEEVSPSPEPTEEVTEEPEPTETEEPTEPATPSPEPTEEETEAPEPTATPE